LGFSLGECILEKTSPRLVGRPAAAKLRRVRLTDTPIVRFALIAFTVLACAIGTTPAPVSARADHLISSRGIGCVTLGLVPGEVSQRCRVVRDTAELNPDMVEEMRRFVLVIGADTVRAEFASDAVTSVLTYSSAFRTKDSLGVGSTLAQLRSHGSVIGGVSEAFSWVRLASECTINFGLDESGDLGQGAAIDSTTIDSIPQDSRVFLVSVDSTTCSSTREPNEEL
jgi:hypothetical protein